jgi:hypothetical protein
MRSAAPLDLRRGLVAAIAILVASLLGAWAAVAGSSSPTSAAQSKTLLPPFFAAGDSAANVPLSDDGQRVLLRWVAHRTGRLKALHLQVKVEGRGYAAGSGGVLRATTHPVLPSGRPNLRVVLAADSFPPRGREFGGAVAVRLGIYVREGEEFATVIRNGASTPSRDFFSVNFLYAKAGVLGANGRNERHAAAADRYYGLDARELVGYSRDAGATWGLPGGPYGPHSGKAFLPTYVLQFAGGGSDGQFYYYSRPVHGSVQMVYPHAPRTTITHIAAYTSDPGGATVVLAVDGKRRAATRLSGEGFLVRRITPVTVPAGATVTLTTMAGPGGLALSQEFADARWVQLIGLGRGHTWYLESDPDTAVPLFPLPRWPSG